MIDLFARGETSATFRARADKMVGEINRFTDEKILGVDFDEWVNYYFDEYKVQPISLFMDNVTQTLTETKVEKHNPWHRSGDPYEPKTYQIDGFMITFSIPFDGDEGLLYMRPSRYYMTTFPVDRVINGNESSYGSIIFSIKYTKQELQGKETPEFVASDFSQKFKYYIENIDRVNSEAEQFNESLPDAIRTVLENRKKKAVEYVTMGELLSIPLKINPNAPNTTPILMKKLPVKKPEMPSVRQREQDYTISANDYENICRIINLAGISMEKAAKTYTKLDEEELRDIVISHLNSHYQGTVTGETFNKVGKTDIHILFGNKAAYIAECKIWHGEKSLQSALEQLFSYTTWRDVKTSIIVFNKSNKDFKRILATIKAFLDKCEICKKNISVSQNEWLCEFKKFKEATDCFTVQIIAFDLHL